MGDLSEISLRERIRLNLISAMEKEGVNQVQLADKLGISKGTVNNWARGNNSPDIDIVPKICKVLNISVLDLYSPTKFEHPESIKVSKTDIHSPEARKLADAYDNKLDRWGRQAVRELVETEIARCEDEAQLRESLLKEEPKVIPLYSSPAAAGYVSPIFGDDFEPYELKPEDPQGAVFAVKVSGDSMEPHFPDGSIAFCNKDPIADGEIGVFCLDGDSFIKQYHYDPFMGMTYLFSLNRKRADADKLVTRSGGQMLTCMGRVMTRKRYPVPGRG